MSPAVLASRLTLRFGRTQALADVSLALDDGVTGLLGPNGAGKTTLMRILATAVTADAGDLSVFGLDPRRVPDRLAIRRRLGYLPQNGGLYPHFTVFEFVDYVAVLKEFTHRPTRHAEVRRVLECVDLGDRRGTRIRALSGGMRQRVGLAAALLGDPGFLVLDEPTVGLDPEQRLRFRELVAGLGEGRPVLLSTHQADDVASLCRRLVVLDGGRVAFDGTPAELAARAAGSVWSSPVKDPRAQAAWRTGDGRYHVIGPPPPGATAVEPNLEDGYLMLLRAPAAERSGVA